MDAGTEVESVTELPDREPSRLSRRELVGSAAAAGAVLAAPGAAEAAARRRPKSSRRTADVVVVGAGLAGLVAARDLRRAGRRVIVMEARGRVGGRCYSRKIPGASDVANLGATFVGPTQRRIVALARDLGIGTFPTYNTGRNVLFFNVRRGEYSGAVPPVNPVALLEAGKAMTQLDGMARTVPLNAPWRAARALEWDSQTFDTWKRDNVLTGDGRKLVDLGIQSIFSIEPRDVSLLFVLFYIHSAGTLGELINTAGGAQESRIEGGAQKIADELARRIGRKRVLLSSPARRIVRRKRGGVDVISDKVSVRARRVIVAVPPAIAGRIRYEPGLPGIRDQLTQRVRGTTTGWLAGGAPVGFTPPGVLLRYGEALRRPVGPIHWSGAETATVWNGYMDGAVQSGERVAREVLAALSAR